MDRENNPYPCNRQIARTVHNSLEAPELTSCRSVPSFAGTKGIQMTDKVAELNTRVTKFASIHTRRINDTREAVFILFKALTPHLTEKDREKITKLLHRE